MTLPFYTCPRCAAQVPPARYCNQCGQVLPQFSGKARRPIWLIFLAALIISLPFAVGGLAVLLMHGDGRVKVHASDIVRHAGNGDGAAFHVDCPECHGGGRIPLEDGGWRVCTKCAGVGRRILGHMSEPRIVPDSAETTYGEDAARSRRVFGW